MTTSWDDFKKTTQKITLKAEKETTLTPKDFQLNIQPKCRKSPQLKLCVPFQKMDRRTFRHFEPQRRIDLHGFTKDQAFHMLQKFIESSYQQGISKILVITGKGSLKQKSPDPLMRTLRQELPFWMTHPTLKPYIISFTPASDRHGGSGAFYISLRKK